MAGFRISSWDEWFDLCTSINNSMRRYEAAVMDYYEFQHGDSSKPEFEDAYYTSHSTNFYDDSSSVPKRKIPGVIAKWLISFVAIFAVFCAVFIFMNLKTFSLVNVLLRSLAFALPISFLVAGFFFFMIVRQKKNIIKRIIAEQDDLLEYIGYIPPVYRDYMSIDLLCEIYNESGGELSFIEMQGACDEAISEVSPMTLYLQFFDDVDFIEPEFMQDAEREAYEEELLSDDPNIPPDILSKTFKGTKDAEMVLDGMIGMEAVKKQVRQMKNRMEFYGSSGGGKQASGNHMAFLGSAGTGKTSIARIITSIFYEFGYIKDNKCVEVDGSYLKSPYVGQTSLRVNSIVNYAKGGVLFIDEAYTLTEGEDDSGAEAVGVLLKAMEDMKKDLIVIFAGYEDNINRLLASNEGFASRIKYKIYFDDFTADELVEIFRKMLMNNSGDSRYRITKQAVELLKSQYEKEKGSPSFGNARTVRNSLDLILDAHADHFQTGDISDDMRFVITEADVMTYVEDRKHQLQDDKRNFMAQNHIDTSIISFNELKDRLKDGSEDPDKDLASMIGLERVKTEVKHMKAEYEFYQGEMQNEGNHMCFVGPPGVGKSSLVSIITGYLYQLGLIQENKYVDVNGDFFRASYLGQTGKRTEATVHFAQGMVLFIDEAYLLSVDEEGDQFGKEAIGVLLDAMEKNRKNFVVIFAGYEDEMNVFLDVNSGLRSRIKTFFHFEQYTPFELAKITSLLAKKAGFKVEKAVWVPYQKFVKEQINKPNFGNARFARSFFDEIKKAHVSNYLNNNMDEAYKFVITVDDLTTAIENHEENA